MQIKLPRTLPFFLLPLLITGCTTHLDTMHTQTIPDAAYQQALRASDPSQHNPPAPGSEAETAMIERVKQLFNQYTEANLSAKIPEVYAEEVYFRDAFKQFSRAEDIREYMLAGLAPLDQCEFVFNRVARSGSDYYFDWTMRLDFKKTPPNTWEESIGVSHMRFNAEGKVIFHQDYWDPTDIVYRRIPIARQLIAYVKKKL
ncbi:MAG: hypothetical protein EA353_01125 [Puniceicoccaceae bacterium]|nr:MAG: hypothetical protein EA353_01125 [Puniceicoccaceae bacterium]